MLRNYFKQHADEVAISGAGRSPLMSQVVANAEKSAMLEALKKCRNNKTEARKLLGLSRKTFYRKMNEYGLL
jgi:transcriptional regulator of acetoin/glycerol metabolism